MNGGIDMKYLFLDEYDGAGSGCIIFCSSRCDAVCSSYCAAVSGAGLDAAQDASAQRSLKLSGCVPFFTAPGKLCSTPRLEKF